MKKVDKAVGNAIPNEPVPNLDASANATSLDLCRDLEEPET